MNIPSRKPNRLENFDYSFPGYYFITICTEKKEKLFWDNASPMQLSELGKKVEQCISEIPRHYSGVKLDKYTVMPNHVHLLLQIEEIPVQPNPPSIPQIVGQLKRTASMRAGRSIWQKSFHDHVIRGEQDYREIWSYIDYNPVKWVEDCFFMD